MLLSRAHEGFLESGQEPHSAGLLRRKHLHELFQVDDGRLELVLLFRALLTGIRQGLFEKVVGQEENGVHRFDLSLNVALLLPYEQGLLGSLKFVVLFTSSGELLLNFERHWFAPKPVSILLILHQLEDELVALRHEEWRNLFNRLFLGSSFHFFPLFHFSAFSIGNEVALIAKADVLVACSPAAPKNLRCHHLLSQYVTFDTSSEQS